MRIARSASRAIHIKLVWATWRVPVGLMPVTAKMTVMITARPSHPNQLISFNPASAHENDSGHRSFSMSQSRCGLIRGIAFDGRKYRETSLVCQWRTDHKMWGMTCWRYRRRNPSCREKCSPERGKQIGRLLHLPILKKPLYRFSLFDIGTNNRCHLHHIDSLTFF